MDQLKDCCICKGRLRGSAVSLPCFHSACLPCVLLLVRKNEEKADGDAKDEGDEETTLSILMKAPPNECPECESPFDLPAGGAEFLPRNEFTVAPKLSDSVARVTSGNSDINNISCEICVEKLATAWCLSCEQFYCDDCRQLHAKQKATSSHIFSNVDDAIAPGLNEDLNQSTSGDLGRTRENLCITHTNQILSVYCNECHHCICSDCAVDEHAGHSVTMLKLIINEARQELEELKTKAKEEEERFAASVQRVEKVMEGVRVSNQVAEADIEELAKLLHTAIDKRKEELIKEAKEAANFKCKELGIQRDDLVFVQRGLRQISTYAEAAVLGTNAEVVTTRDMADMRRKTLLGIPNALEPAHDATIMFHHDNGYKLTQVIHSVGRVITSHDDAGTVSQFVRDYDTVKGTLLQIGSPGSKERCFNGVAAVAVNSKGHILTAEYNTHRVQVFNDKGSLQFGFGELGRRNSTFDSPYGICVDQRDDRIIVSDGGNHRIQVFNDRGTHLLNIGSMGFLPGQLLNPRGVCVDRAGDILVADMGNHRVQVFDHEGHFVRRFGTCGTDPGCLFNPIGIGVLLNGKIVVSECSNSRIQIFSSKGLPLRVVGVGLLLHPWHLFVDSMDNILVADCNNNRVQVFSQYGGLQASLGSGHLSGPTGISMDREGRIVVSEIVAQRITIL